jgi:hypothetical protein
MATAAIELLVKQAVEDRFTAGDLPDRSLLGTSTRIAIREEMPAAGVKLGGGALPQLEGYEFYLISGASAQSEAERTQRAITFITVDGPSITDDTATVSLGVDVTAPLRPNEVKLCCCSGEAQFRRAEGRWTFVNWVGTTCS